MNLDPDQKGLVPGRIVWIKRAPGRQRQWGRIIAEREEKGERIFEVERNHQGGTCYLRRDDFVLKQRPRDLRWPSMPASGRRTKFGRRLVKEMEAEK